MLAIGYLKNKNPRHQFAVGSFLIIALIGILSIRALAPGDRLIDWVPPNSEIYLHLRLPAAEKILNKIGSLEPFGDNGISLSRVIPPNAEQIGIFQNSNRVGVLIFSKNNPPAVENLLIKKIDENIFIISSVDFGEFTKNENQNLARRNNAPEEPLMNPGYIFLNQPSLPSYVPLADGWSDYSEIATQPSAWSLDLKSDAIIWKNLTSPVITPTVGLKTSALPQNAIFWTHGDSWQKSWQESLSAIPSGKNSLTAAATALKREFENINQPDETFQPLLAAAFDLFIVQKEDYSFILKLEKSTDENPLWRNNFEKYWMDYLSESAPERIARRLPDGSTAAEIVKNSSLTWKEQRMDDESLRWIENKDHDFLLGYFETPDSVILSNNYGNLIDFLYAKDMAGWTNLPALAERCNFNQNQLASLFSPREDIANFSEFFPLFGPWLVNASGDLCHFE